MDISLKIKQLRIEKKIEQTQLAEAIGMSSAMISLYELGKKQPTLKALKKIAEYFSVTTDYFISENEIKSSNKVSDNSLLERTVDSLNRQFEFLQKNYERIVEENGRLTKIIDNLTSNGNFQEGNDMDSSPEPGEVVILRAA